MVDVLSPARIQMCHGGFLGFSTLFPLRASPAWGSVGFPLLSEAGMDLCCIPASPLPSG